MLLEFRDITKSFGEKTVLSGVSLSAEGGRAFGLLGRNGAGKTTAIRILMGVFPADSGEILLDGRPINRRQIGLGYLPEERGLYPKKPILDQLVYFAELYGMKRRDATLAVDAWLERLGMSEYRTRRLDTLSKGNQQKIQLVTALAHDPDIVILDEPFSGLDPVNAMLLKDVVREEIAKGKIVLFSSHQMSYIEEFCDSIAILNAGRIVLSGDLAAIRDSYPADRLTVRAPEPGPLLAAFGDACTPLGDGRLLLRLRDEGERFSVMRRLTEEFRIDEVGVLRPSLSDIFVEYTREQV